MVGLDFGVNVKDKYGLTIVFHVTVAIGSAFTTSQSA